MGTIIVESARQKRDFAELKDKGFSVSAQSGG
jgi:hypothetical protein